MSYEEKVTWAFLGVAGLASVGYLIWLVPQFSSQAPGQIAYVVPMLVAIGVAIVAAIGVYLLIGMTQERRRDQRDREIERYSQHNSQTLLEIGVIAALGMAMFKLEHFWIAHTLYVAFVGTAILGSVIKILAYHQGFVTD